MATNIEKLQTRVEDTKNQIEKSKALSSVEKIKKAKALESIISKIKSDLDALRVSATPEQLVEIEALESSYEEMSLQFNTEFKQELSDLEEEVVDSVKETEDEILEEKENFKKKKGWLGRQLEGITSKDEWKDNTGKNIARAIGGVGAIWVGSKILKGIGNLFRGKDKKEGPDGSDSKPRYKKRWGVGAIGVGGFFGLKRLMAGKRPREGGNKMNDESADKLNDFNKLQETDPEKFKQYQGLGTNVNGFYDKIRDNEKKMGYDNQSKLGTIGENVKFKDGLQNETVYTGLVPFCMDQNYDDISELLSERGLNTYLFSKDFKQYKSEILGWTNDKISRLLGPFLGTLDSFSMFIGGGGDIRDNVIAWLDSDPEERKKELDFFFRQYTKVLTYTADKKYMLEKAIVIEKIKENEFGKNIWPSTADKQNDMLEDAFSDQEFMKKVENDNSYILFMGGKLNSIDEILQKKGLSNGKLSPGLEHKIESLDHNANELLDYNKETNSNIFSSIEKDFTDDGSIENTTVDEIKILCDNISEDVADESGEGFMQRNFDWLTHSFNMESDAKKLFLEESGLNSMLSGFVGTIEKLKLEIIKNPTKATVETLKKTILEYLAFKKELEVAIHTLVRIRSDDPDYIGRFFNSIFKIFGNFKNSINDIIHGKFSWTTGIHLCTGLVVSGGILTILGSISGSRSVKISGKLMMKTGILPITIAKKGVEKLAGGKVSQWGWKKSILKTKELHPRFAGDEFKYAVLNNKINKQHYLEECVDGIKVYGIDPDSPTIRNDLLKKYLDTNDDAIIEAYKKNISNKKLRKLMFKFDKNGANIIDKVTYTGKGKIKMMPKSGNLNKLKEIDILIESGGTNTKDFFEGLLKKTGSPEYLNKVHKLSQDQDFLKKLQKVDFDSISIKQFLKNTGKNIKKLDNVTDGIKGGKNIQEINQKSFGVKYANNLDNAASGSQEIIHDISKIDKHIKQAITNDLDVLNTKYKNASDLNHKTHIKNQITSLEEFRGNIRKMDKASQKTFKNLEKMGIKPRHIAELFELNEKYFNELVNKKTVGGMAEYLDSLNSTKKTKISEDLIGSFKRTSFDSVIKNSDEMASSLKSIFKFLSKIS